MRSDKPSTEEQPKPVQQSFAENQEVGISLYGIAGISGFVSLIVGICLLVGYHAFFAPPSKVGMIDLTSILETKELIFTEMITKPNVTDQDRDAAYEMVRATGPQIEAAIEELQKECGCLLMTKAAVIGDSAEDLTPVLKAKLGIDSVDVKTLQSSIRARMGAEVTENGK